MTRETFHVRCITARGGRYTIVRYASDHDAAKAAAEADGHAVVKVRRAPCPPRSGRQGGLR